MPKLPENVSIFVRFHFTLTIFLDCADELSASICRLPSRISYLKEQRDSDWEFAHDLEKDRLLFKTEIKTYREMNERKFCFSMFSLFILCCFRESFTQPLKRIKTQTKQIKHFKTYRIRTSVNPLSFYTIKIQKTRSHVYASNFGPSTQKCTSALVRLIVQSEFE